MAVFLSRGRERRLDNLGDVQGFGPAKAGIAYSFLRDSSGGEYRPIPTSEAAGNVAPDGGLEKNNEGLLKIKPDTTGSSSGVGLSSDGLEIVDRVKTAGDTMSGALNIEDADDDFSLEILAKRANKGIHIISGAAEFSRALTMEAHDGSITGFIGNSPTGIRIYNETTATALDVGDTIDCSSTRISSVADPTDTQDAATKNYVDSKVSAKANKREYFFVREGSVVTGTQFSTGDQERNSFRNYPIINKLFVARFAVMMSDRAQTAQLGTAVSFQLVKNGSLVGSVYTHTGQAPYVQIFNILTIEFQAGDQLGLSSTPTVNDAFIHVVVEGIDI